MLRYLTALLLSICMLAAAAVRADDHPARTHEWNDREDPHWHDYLKGRHKKDHDWGKATKREQKGYWKWRDAHPD